MQAQLPENQAALDALCAKHDKLLLLYHETDDPKLASAALEAIALTELRIINLLPPSPGEWDDEQ